MIAINLSTWITAIIEEMLRALNLEHGNQDKGNLSKIQLTLLFLSLYIKAITYNMLLHYTLLKCILNWFKTVDAKSTFRKSFRKDCKLIS